MKSQGTHTHNHFTALWSFSGTTRVSRYQKKHSPTHTYRGHQSSLICFIHLLRSMASSLYNPCTWQSFSTISLQVFFGLPLVWHPLPHTVTVSALSVPSLILIHQCCIVRCRFRSVLAQHGWKVDYAATVRRCAQLLSFGQWRHIFIACLRCTSQWHQLLVTCIVSLSCLFGPGECSLLHSKIFLHVHHKSLSCAATTGR